MASSIGFNPGRQALAVRIERYADAVQDWIFPLMLVAATVGVLIECALSLNGWTIV